MYCNEFPSIITNVNLLTEGTDCQFNTSFLKQQPVVTLGTYTPSTSSSSSTPSSSSTSSTSSTAEGTSTPDILIGSAPELLFTPNTATIKSSDTVSQAGRKHKVTLEYEMSNIDYTPSDYSAQITNLANKHYSLLITFFGGLQAIVRCDKYGDGFLYRQTDDKVLKCTITIENINGLQKVSWT